MGKSIFEGLPKHKDTLLIEEIYDKGKDFIENAFDIILIVNKKGKILYGNKKAIEAYGYTFDELINIDIFTLRNESTMEFTQRQLEKALDRGIKFKTYHYRKDGSKFPVEVRSIYSNKKIKNMVVSIIRDISEIEEEYKNAKLFSMSLDILDDPFVIFTKEMNISNWSKGAEAKFGFKKEEVIGKNMSELLPNNILDESKSIVRMLSKGEIVKDYETVRLDKNGEILNVLVSASPIYDGDGGFSGVLAIYKDITDRKLIEKKLQEKCEQLELLKQKAEAANKAKSIFLADMSHEIRTPMNGILATIQLLRSECVSDEQSKYIKILNESANTMLNVINNLLDISKIESGTFKLNDEPFNLRETINNIYNNLLIIGDSKGLEVSYYLDPNIDYEIIGDELRLKVILNNLISNAVKFTDEGYVSFRVKMISSDDVSEKIEFRIKDSGIGIDEEFKEKIFNDYSQGNLSTSKKQVGTGLGLAISQQFAAIMNGNICFESKVGKGSTFIFTCEFKKSKKKEQNFEIRTIVKKQVEVNKVERNEVILCVEDNLINQEVMEGIIKNKGYKYIGAYNGNEALEILKNNKVDLILMDIQMPELNGFETTKIIRAEEFGGKHIPIIAMTAYAMREDKDKCMQADMDDYIVKPFDIEKLYEIVEIHLKK
ncbi:MULTISPECIES: PAS domain-containing hybrid sensor histidine kinase/response regulator [unclassified Clostridium]|uniref:PAS domain-containing hybrid sensor histidine kinase/response regulator n=1 Tax=unclassified Clostridium TaxID=2614128 RepID=UPI0002972B2F|nr:MULTISPECIES: PAS domain-containing hybrid sensor histidine kinase/response regulator [unclassified Clostridium]EKQ57186.1 MAG: PAS domain S-box [Clostridium sp. Maddingley MBC34-26]